jgi:translation initiation factor 4B
MSLGDFLSDGLGGGGSWADEVEETYVTGTQQLPPSDRNRSGGTSMWQDRGYSVRERDSYPQQIPDRPPYTAHLGNLSYDATTETVTEFFEGCDVATVRIIEDREMMRPKGFGYVEFSNAEGLKKALELDGESFQGRMIKIKIADPPRGGNDRGESTRDLSNWTRSGPLPDLPRSGGRQQSDFGGERRPSRDPAMESRAPREHNWERRGPLAAPEGMEERSESQRGPRTQSPAAWGEGGRPRREFVERPERPERPERTATAAEKDFQWRERMRPGAAAKSPEPGETPTSPSAPAQPAGRPRLNLQKRTVSEAPDALSPGSGDAKASPFGAARPIDTATREKEIEEKRQQAIVEKREADEKAKEERRLAKEAAAKAEAEAEAEAEAKAKADAEAEAKASEEAAAAAKEAEQTKAEKPAEKEGEQKMPIRSREPREPREPREAPKSRATETGNWRSSGPSEPRGGYRGAAGGPRGGRGGRGDGPSRAPRGDVRDVRNEPRAPRANGSSGQEQEAGGEPETPTKEEDGWTTVPNKKGRPGRV